MRALVVMGAVAPTPLRLRKVEQQLAKKKLSVDAIEEAGRTSLGEHQADHRYQRYS